MNLVVGAGITGLTIARRLAELGHEVTVIEKRDHIGGHCYDYFDSGNYVQKYGPHIFHTKHEKVWDFLSWFTDWHTYTHRVKASIDGKLVPLPFNLKSIEMCFDDEKAEAIKEALIKEVGRNNKISILELLEKENPLLQELGQFVYDKVFLNYTIKQWDMSPKDISPKVTARVPVVVSYDDRYFHDKHQAIPSKGYYEMFKNMADHENITIVLEQDYKELTELDKYERVFITSPLDEYFDFKLGKVAYRRLVLEFEEKDTSSFQELPVINYPNDHDFTRISEYNKFLDIKNTTTIISKEYPSWKKGFIAYPVFTEENKVMIDKYMKLAMKLKNVYFAGRLAESKYYNMDDACLRGMTLVEEIFGKK